MKTCDQINFGKTMNHVSIWQWTLVQY